MGAGGSNGVLGKVGTVLGIVACLIALAGSIWAASGAFTGLGTSIGEVGRKVTALDGKVVDLPEDVEKRLESAEKGFPCKTVEGETGPAPDTENLRTELREHGQTIIELTAASAVQKARYDDLFLFIPWILDRQPASADDEAVVALRRAQWGEPLTQGQVNRQRLLDEARVDKPADPDDIDAVLNWLQTATDEEVERVRDRLKIKKGEAREERAPASPERPVEGNADGEES